MAGEDDDDGAALVALGEQRFALAEGHDLGSADERLQVGLGGGAEDAMLADDRRDGLRAADGRLHFHGAVVHLLRARQQGGGV